MLYLSTNKLTDEEKELLKHNPNVTVAFCNERFGRIMDKLIMMDTKIIVVDTKIDKIQMKLESDKKEDRKETTQKTKEFRVFLYSIVGSVVSAIIIAGVFALTSH